MRQDRVKIATIKPTSTDVERQSCFLKIAYFIGKFPINTDYIKEGESNRLFETKGEALDYAIDKLHCDYVVVDNAKESNTCSILAEVRGSPFFKAPPLRYTACY